MVELLTGSRDETVGTSVRIPIDLRDAALAAAELGLVPSLTDLVVHGLRERLDAIVNQAVLEEHFKQYPEARPTLAEVALAGAELDDNPLKHQPELIERAAEEITTVMDDPSPDDVLMFAAGYGAGYAACLAATA